MGPTQRAVAPRPVHFARGACRMKSHRADVRQGCRAWNRQSSLRPPDLPARARRARQRDTSPQSARPVWLPLRQTEESDACVGAAHLGRMRWRRRGHSRSPHGWRGTRCVMRAQIHQLLHRGNLPAPARDGPRRDMSTPRLAPVMGDGERSNADHGGTQAPQSPWHRKPEQALHSQRVH